MDKPAMIVEDEPTFRRALKEFLRKRYPTLRVIQAGDAPEAWDNAIRHTPNLIFVDIRLPSGNGLDLTRRVKTRLPATTVVVCTVHNLPEYRQAAFDSGASHFIAKDELGGVRDVVEAIVNAPGAGRGPAEAGT